MDIPTVELNNGMHIPQFGLGVYQVDDGDEVETAVLHALKSGYRLIDTAAMYRNEVGVGRAIKASGIPREEIFVTTKLWNQDQGYEKALAACNDSLEKLQLEYIDLYLIHWPSPARGLYVETWKAFEELYELGKVKSIGVSNFNPDHLDTLLESAKVVPAVNQIELHPYLPQHSVVEYCRQKNIAVEAWSPIGGSRGSLLDDPAIIELATDLGKTPAQIVLRWHIQKDNIVIPKSVHAERIDQNIDIFDFELSDDNMNKIDALENGTRMGPDPATASF